MNAIGMLLFVGPEPGLRELLVGLSTLLLVLLVTAVVVRAVQVRLTDSDEPVFEPSRILVILLGLLGALVVLNLLAAVLFVL